MWQRLKQRIWKWRGVLITAPSVAGLVIAASSAGLLQLMEWSVYDQIFRLRPREPIDPRVVIVTIDESDVRNVGQWPASDAVLAQLIEKLKAQQPRAIGLDLYRDLPVMPGHEALVKVFKSTPNLIGVEKAVRNKVAPPPSLSKLNQVGIADLVLDTDGKVRRGLLTVKGQDGKTRESLAVKLALMYLENEGITLQEFNPQEKRYRLKQRYRLGRAVFSPFTGNEGGYVNTNAGGYQILLNFRGTQEDFHTLSLTDVLENRIPRDLIRDRLILIGSSAQSLNDHFFTPYTGKHFNTPRQSDTSPQQMPGVVVHANLVSQILSAAQEGRPLIKGWAKPVEWLWILAWSFAGATVGVMLLRVKLFRRYVFLRWIALGICVLPAGGILFAGSYLALVSGGWWIPVVSPWFALTGSVVAIALYQSLELQREKTDLEILLENTTEHYDSIASELQNQAQEAARYSERKLAQFLEGVSVGVAVIDATGQPYFINQKAQELLGKGVRTSSIEQLSEVYQLYIAGTNQLYPVENLSIVRALKGERTTTENIEIHQGGKIIPIEAWGTPIYDESGNITFAIAAFQDITERLRSQDALRQAEEKYRGIFENALEGIFQTTPEGRYLSANPAMAQIYGYSSAEELMKSITDIRRQVYVNPNRRATFISLMQQQGAVSGFESPIYRKDGTIIWISETARAVSNANGKLLYYQGFVVEITERKQAELERQKFINQLYELNQANERFVPRQFLQLLNKQSISDVQLGDQVELFMSILFADIRNFTTLSEKMTPEENFEFINAYLSYMEPLILENNGFIDKYIGDAIMALFSRDADDAVKAGIDMLNRLTEYNTTKTHWERPPIRIGIGINTGSLMLGTVGGQNRMDGTVIGDAVNLAFRLEKLTKDYGVSLVISHHTFQRMHHPVMHCFRFIDQVKVKGKSESVSVFEVFDADPPELREGKLATKAMFEEALFLYSTHSFKDAAQLLQDCLKLSPKDTVAQIYLKRCQQLEVTAWVD